MPDKCVDLVLTDPPYGIGSDRNLRANTQYGHALAPSHDYGVGHWDRAIPDGACFREIRRVSSHQIVWGGNYFTAHLEPSPSWLVWDKVTGDNGYADCELAWTSHDSAVRYFRWQWKGFLQERMGGEKEFRYHPTQKPVPLFVWCLQRFSQPGDLILDPFAGSGTTALACHALGRRFICIEREPEYVGVARQRLRDAQAQGDLFREAGGTAPTTGSMPCRQVEMEL
jgi:hypothetical protein